MSRLACGQFGGWLMVSCFPNLLELRRSFLRGCFWSRDLLGGRVAGVWGGVCEVLRGGGGRDGDWEGGGGIQETSSGLQRRSKLESLRTDKSRRRLAENSACSRHLRFPDGSYDCDVHGGVFLLDEHHVSGKD